MRASIASFIGGELIGLIGLGLWSLSLALVVAGVQLVAIGLLRESRAQAGRKPQPRIGGRSSGTHRRRASVRRFVDRARPALKLVRGVAS